MKAATTFRQPEYLTANDFPRYRIRCPVHGFIRFSENERRIIDHWIFRRLRHIRQLALTEMVYPGATHTRFEHSLGVMELASRAFDQLAATRGDLLEANLKRVAELKRNSLAIARQIVRMAGLLHDVGHACFSHAAEAVIHRDRGHESFTFKLVEEREFLGKELDNAYFAGFSTLLGKKGPSRRSSNAAATQSPERSRFRRDGCGPIRLPVARFPSLWG